MFTLGVILARAGSKGLPNKCLRPLRGRPVIEYTFDHAQEARHLDAVALSTDCPEVIRLAQMRGIACIERPARLADDTARLDDALRHAVYEHETRCAHETNLVVMLYGNVPVRRPGIIDEGVQHLIETGADSVQTVAPVGKHHPDWMFRLHHDRMNPVRPNPHYRRQDLEPLYLLDGGLTVMTRSALFGATDKPDEPHAFLGRDRRAIVVAPHDTVDVDEPIDLHLAEAILAARAARP
jgi:CMP-N-acetylneuraminic acid synthetase